MIKEQRREILRQKKRKRNILIVLALMVLLAVAGVLLVTQVFTVKKVNVVGNELYTDEQIKEIVLSDEYSWSTLYVYLEDRFFHTQKLPFSVPHP